VLIIRRPSRKYSYDESRVESRERYSEVRDCDLITRPCHLERDFRLARYLRIYLCSRGAAGCSPCLASSIKVSRLVQSSPMKIVPAVIANTWLQLVRYNGIKYRGRFIGGRIKVSKRARCQSQSAKIDLRFARRSDSDTS